MIGPSIPSIEELGAEPTAAGPGNETGIPTLTVLPANGSYAPTGNWFVIPAANAAILVVRSGSHAAAKFWKAFTPAGTSGTRLLKFFPWAPLVVPPYHFLAMLHLLFGLPVVVSEFLP